jgi:hypothetical protein
MSTPSPTQSVAEKGGAGFEGITMLLCENPLSPLPQAVDAAAAVLPRSNHCTEPHSAPLRAALGELLDVPEGLIHINSGSKLIPRQLFARLGERVHLVTPTYALFPEISHQMTEIDNTLDELVDLVNGRDLDGLNELLAADAEAGFLGGSSRDDVVDGFNDLFLRYPTLIVTRGDLGSDPIAAVWIFDREADRFDPFGYMTFETSDDAEGLIQRIEHIDELPDSADLDRGGPGAFRAPGVGGLV